MVKRPRVLVLGSPCPGGKRVAILEAENENEGPAAPAPAPPPPLEAEEEEDDDCSSTASQTPPAGEGI